MPDFRRSRLSYFTSSNCRSSLTSNLSVTEQQRAVASGSKTLISDLKEVMLQDAESEEDIQALIPDNICFLVLVSMREARALSCALENKEVCSATIHVSTIAIPTWLSYILAVEAVVKDNLFVKSSHGFPCDRPRLCYLVFSS